MEDQLILVDVYDHQTGTAGKEEAHRKGLLHRAFSVFLVRDGSMLIQQRALHKYHSGGLWANACCSHPRSGEELTQAVPRRLKEELGIPGADVKELFSFVYRHAFTPELYEYEYDHVFVGTYNDELALNPEEACACRWVPFEELALELKDHPERFAVWFLTAAPAVLKFLSQNHDIL